MIVFVDGYTLTSEIWPWLVSMHGVLVRLLGCIGSLGDLVEQVLGDFLGV
ncbi:unnamed protein product [Linum tenue]|uniref:Uncharacterized protein n=1 Tax=Linum tenue TaxID=586396 RepID=A0AAV0JPV2_9ROSI|nr:unnamed protein product [Linum tenue]